VPDPPITALDAALRERRFVVTAELTSPVGANAASVRRRARLLRGQVVAANVPDGQAATAHLGALAAARLLLEEGLEPVLTLQCRDRNRLALQAELIGASALGVHNVLCLTGDAAEPASFKPVFDLDSVGLLRAATALSEGRLLDGTPFRSPPRIVPGAAAHPLASSRHERIERLQAKIDAGARFVQTQYVFDVVAFSRWMEEVRAVGLHRRVAILASVGPPRSPRVMAFLDRLPGVRIPRAITERLAGLTDERFAEESLAICAETAAELAAIPGVAGIHIMAPYWEQRIPEIIERAALSGRTERSAG